LQIKEQFVRLDLDASGLVEEDEMMESGSKFEEDMNVHPDEMNLDHEVEIPTTVGKEGDAGPTLFSVEMLEQTCLASPI
jgi:hypothetical protein